MNNAGQSIANGVPGEGQPKEQSIRVEMSLRPRQLTSDEKELRIAQLAALREKYRTGKNGPTVDEILDELRADRV